jgi:HK97 family phage prohead protease
VKINANEIQRRYLGHGESGFQAIRSEGGEETFKIKGTPVVYNRETVLYESEYIRISEIIESGAARNALLRAEQVLLWNHDSSKPMAARKNNTLTVREDAGGVHIEADMGGTVWGREGFEAIRAGLVDKMSFGFYLKEDGYTEERTAENGKRIYKRIIKAFDRIVDFSPVTYPAFEDTSVSARDAESVMKDFAEDEEKRNAAKTKAGELCKEFAEKGISA